MKIVNSWWHQRWAPLSVLILMSLITIVPQLLTGSTIVGSDGIFHFNRIYDAAKQISNWNFSYFQTNYGFQQSGRIVNAVYGPYFAYLTGFLLVIFRSWYHFQLVTTFAVYLIGGWGMYRLTRIAGAHRGAGLITALIFMNVGWLPRWGFNQNMNGIGAALMPYVIACGIQMVHDQVRPIHIVQLTLIMSVLIETHVLSTLMAVILLVPFWIVGMWRSDHRLLMIRNTAIAIGLTLLLTANVWGGMLSLYANNSLALPHSFQLAQNTLHITKLMDHRDSISIYLIIIFIWQVGLLLWHRRQVTRINWMVSGLGIIFLWLTSRFFPWQTVNHAIPVLSQVLQFPVRITIVAYPLLLCGLALSLSLPTKLPQGKDLMLPIMILAVLSVAVPNITNISQRSEQVQHRKVLKNFGGLLLLDNSPKVLRKTLNSKHPGALLELAEKHSSDYLPINGKQGEGQQNPGSIYKRQILLGHQFFSFTVLSHGRLELQWHADNKGWQMTPVVSYHDSTLTLNGKKLARSEYRRTHINVPIVYAHKGTNKLIIRYATPIWVSVLIGASLVSWFGLGCYGLYELKKVWIEVNRT